MNTNEYDQQVKSYLQRRPFRRFRIVFFDGDTLTIRKSSDLFSHAGAAVYFDSTSDAEMTLFHAEDVTAIEPVSSGKRSKAAC